MAYCPNCGNEIENHDPEVMEARAAEHAARDADRAAVEIEKIRADKEIRLARIAAGIADAERDQELAHAEGRAEGMAEVVSAGVPDPEPIPDPEPVEPIVIADDTQTDDMTPPETQHEVHSEPKKTGLGMW
jgi:hypothetical protein